MAFYATDGPATLGGSVCECREETDASCRSLLVKPSTPSKNRVGVFSTTPARNGRPSASQTLADHCDTGTIFSKTASGVRYYGYRFYHPEFGRWVNRDPIGERGGLNEYGFAGNAPTVFFDILGLAADLSKYVLDVAPCEWMGTQYAGKDELGSKTVGRADCKEDHILGPRIGKSHDCTICGKPGKKYDMDTYKCTVRVLVLTGLNPAHILHNQSLWAHEKTHVETFVSYVKKAIAVVKNEGGRCLPNECDEDRKKYIETIVRAFRLEMYHLDAKLHSWDSPENQLEKWKKISEGYFDDYEKLKAEAEGYKKTYLKCLNKFMLEYYQNKSKGQ